MVSNLPKAHTACRDTSPGGLAQVWARDHHATSALIYFVVSACLSQALVSTCLKARTIFSSLFPSPKHNIWHAVNAR